MAMSGIPDISSPLLPHWAPRVGRNRIGILYHSVGRGIIDEELIDDVGHALLARCESILRATEASRGSAACPACKAIVKHTCLATERLSCLGCGWSCVWDDYRKTYQHKQLLACGLEDFVREYAQQYPAAKSAQERLILIDTLIHRWHWEQTGFPARPGSANLIEGKMDDVVAFLDALSYGDQIPPDIEARREIWRANRKRKNDYWAAKFKAQAGDTV